MTEPLPELIDFSIPAQSQFGLERAFPIHNLVSDLWDSAEDLPKTKNSDNIAISANHTSPDRISPDETEALERLPPSQEDKSLISSPYSPVPPKDSLLPFEIRASHKSPAPPNENDERNANRITERAQLVPAASGPQCVAQGVTLNDETDLLLRCEDEPLYIPGAIQQYGALLALRYDQLGNLQVRIASENSVYLLGYSSDQLFELISFLDIVQEHGREDTVARISDALENINKSSADTHLDVFQITIMSPSGSQIPLWCAAHIAQGTTDLLVFEFEALSDACYLDGAYNNRLLPKTPLHRMNNEVTPEVRSMSTTCGSIPLSTAWRSKGEQYAVFPLDVLNAMTQAQQQLASAISVQSVLDTVVGLISDLTVFHRVIFYRLDCNKHGCVDAELVDPLASNDFLRGMYFPAYTFPEQTRKLYEVNRLRLLYGRDQGTARLVCRDISDFERKLDLTHSYLHAISPIHLKYMAETGARSFMSISIVIDDALWGSIVCHGYEDDGIRITLPIRELCRNIGECASINIQRQLMLQQLNARTPSLMTNVQNPPELVPAPSLDLLAVFGADFGLLSIHNEIRAIGKLNPSREALAILAYLQICRFSTIVDSRNINKDFADVKCAPGIMIIAGLLVIPLSDEGNDFIVFFRKKILNEAQRTDKSHTKIEKASSDPEKQFHSPERRSAPWVESREWSEDQLDTASLLSLLYRGSIIFWRQKEQAGQSTRMAQLLIRDSAHEVQTPLNAIMISVEEALLNKVDDNTRDILSKAHQASRSLLYAVDDLLNLTKAENGQANVVNPESFDLAATVSEVIVTFEKEATRKSLDLTVSTHHGIPEMVKGDASRLRQALLNVTSNAFQHSIAGPINVDIRPLEVDANSSIVIITIQDSGAGMSECQLDDLFQEFEQIVKDEPTSSNLDTTMSDKSLQQALGIGLAFVARFVRNMNGQIRVRSELGKGTIVGIGLPFEHAVSIPSHVRDTPMLPAQSSLSAIVPRPLPSTSLSMIASPNSTRAALKETLKKAESHPTLDQIVAAQQKSLRPLTNRDELSDKDLSNRRYSMENRKPVFPIPNIDKQADIRGEPMHILVAEDNSVNIRLLTRQLHKAGHQVKLAVNGQDCYDQFVAKPRGVHVILMDIQMLLVDGSQSISMIRRHEHCLEDLHNARFRIPIIAVSASLREVSRLDYIQNGFDGWISNPITLRRLDYLLKGVKQPEMRRDALYQPGQWELGDLHKRSAKIFELNTSNTLPMNKSGARAVISSTPLKSSLKEQYRVSTQRHYKPTGVSSNVLLSLLKIWDDCLH